MPKKSITGNMMRKSAAEIPPASVADLGRLGTAVRGGIDTTRISERRTFERLKLDTKRRLPKCKHVLGLALFITAFTPTHAKAIAPSFVPDDELARQPIIVVAKWNKAPLKTRSRTEDVPGFGKVCRECETHTVVTVERVIAGDIKPGTHKILLDCFIGWMRKDGGPVMSFTSTEMIGDVEQVTDSNLWFLVPKRSWDKTDTTNYLGLTTYRGVQPLKLEAYFRALRAEKPKEEVPKLLASEAPLVIERVLRFLNGDVLPWPYGPDFIERRQGVKRRWDPMTQYAGEVEKLLQRKQPEIRRQAAAVYAEFAARNSLPRMRQLLADADACVRGIAIGILARHDDRPSSEAICRASKGIQDGATACEIIERLRAWRNLETVPALMSFLENDGFAYRYGHADGAPALKAQAALKELTGHDFPGDVEAAQKAWAKAKMIGDAKKRAAYLARILPHDPQPLEGKLVKDGKGFVLLLTNRGKQSVLVTKEPTGIGYRATNGIGYHGNPGERKSKDAYVKVSAGGTLRVKLDPEWGERSTLKRITVYFLDNGSRIGMKAWIGTVVVVLDPKWDGSFKAEGR